MSLNNPNLQNAPDPHRKREDKYRAAFVPHEPKSISSCLPTIRRLN
ncbi:MAG: hypothetical protein U5K54_29470 [Cytophagales bacterium]|nr:hypothetical protein [Cytophagales bacterium]